MQPSRVFPTHRLGNWVDGNRMHLKIHQNSFYGISFLILCTGGSDVITCRGGITSGSYISQSCIYLVLRHLFVRLNCVLGWGVPLLCKAFGGFALTFSGNTYLIKICVFDFQSSINRLCVTFHSHFFSILLFVLPLRTELSTHFILIKVCCYNG